jgi:hypothetical protein
LLLLQVIPRYVILLLLGKLLLRNIFLLTALIRWLVKTFYLSMVLHAGLFLSQNLYVW